MSPILHGAGRGRWAGPRALWYRGIFHSTMLVLMLLQRVVVVAWPTAPVMAAKDTQHACTAPRDVGAGLFQKAEGPEGLWWIGRHTCSAPTSQPEVPSANRSFSLRLSSKLKFGGSVTTCQLLAVQPGSKVRPGLQHTAQLHAAPAGAPVPVQSEQPWPRASPGEVPQLTAGCGSGALYRVETGQQAGGAWVPAGLSPRCAHRVCEGLIWEDVLIIKLLSSFFFPSGDDLITARSPWQPRLQKTPPMGTWLQERTGAGGAHLPHGGMEPGSGRAGWDAHPTAPRPVACPIRVRRGRARVLHSITPHSHSLCCPRYRCCPQRRPLGSSSAGLPAQCGCLHTAVPGGAGPHSPTAPGAAHACTAAASAARCVARPHRVAHPPPCFLPLPLPVSEMK